MAQLIIAKDPLPALIAALRSECAKVVGAPVKVSSILAKDPGAGNTIHVYVAGGYPKTMVSSTATVLMHCYAKDGPTAQRLAAAAAAVVALDRQEWHQGRVPSGPYDKPPPDHPPPVSDTQPKLPTRSRGASMA